MKALRIHFVLICVFCTFAASAATEGNSGPVWRVEYSTSGQAPIPPSGEPKLAAGPDGIYAYGFAEPGVLGSVVAKVDPTTANFEWSAIAPLETELGAKFDRVVALADGPLSLAGSISRLNLEGNVVWSIPRSPDYFYGYASTATSLIGSGLLQLAQSNGLPNYRASFEIRVLDPVSGVTLDQLSLAIPEVETSDCRLIDLANVNSTTSYVASNCVGGKLVKLNLFPLSVGWVLPTSMPDIDFLQSMRADASGVYITGMRQGNSFLSKLAPADASTLWTVERAGGTLEHVRIDIDGNPVVYGSGGGDESTLEKFEAATGASLWTHQNAGKITELFVASGALVVAGSDRLSPTEFDTRGFVERIDPSNGASQWRSVLIPPAGGSSSATSVVQQGDRLVVAGVACAPAIGSVNSCNATFWRASASSNAVADAAQSPAQIRVTTNGLASVGSDDSVYAVVSERAGSNAQLRITRQRKSDGLQLWQSFLPIDLNTDSWRGVDRFEMKLTGDGNLVILLASDPVDFVGPADARVVKISAADGVSLWSRDLIDPSIGKTDVYAARIASDQVGNVFVPAHERYVDLGNPSIVTRKRVLHKLSSTAGASLWQVEFDPLDAVPYYSIPIGYVAGNDFLATESPLPTSQRAWTAIDGATGTVNWINPALPIYEPAVIDGGKVVVAEGETELRITRFSPSSGTIAWQTVYDGANDHNFSVRSGVEDDGVLFLGGSRRTWSTSSGFLVSRSIVAAIQATDGAIEWVNTFDEIPDAGGAALPKFIADGLLYVSRPILTPTALPPSSLSVGSELTSLSRITGTRVGSQLRYRQLASHPHLGLDFNSILYRTAGGKFFTMGVRQVAGGPSNFTVASWNVPSVEQIGSLVVSLSVSVENAGSNLRYSYVFTTENQGEVTADDVFGLLSLPDDSRSIGVTCLLNGAACAATTTATSIEARVDLPAASVLVVQGSFEVPGGSDAPHQLLATSFAPLEFVEYDLSDNVRSFFFSDRIFGNGFE